MEAVFGFLLGLAKQTLATSRRVRRELPHDQLFRHATPRHATLRICLAPEPADGAQEVSQKDSLRLRTVQEEEGQGIALSFQGTTLWQ
jgi:hypothetical protein